MLRTAYYCLLATHYLLPTTFSYYILPATFHVLPTTYYSLLTTYYVLLTTHYSLLTTRYLLLTHHYFLLTTTFAPALQLTTEDLISVPARVLLLPPKLRGACVYIDADLLSICYEAYA